MIQPPVLSKRHLVNTNEDVLLSKDHDLVFNKRCEDFIDVRRDCYTSIIIKRATIPAFVNGVNYASVPLLGELLEQCAESEKADNDLTIESSPYLRNSLGIWSKA